jgi:hypothetical protein
LPASQAKFCSDREREKFILPKIIWVQKVIKIVFNSIQEERERERGYKKKKKRERDSTKIDQNIFSTQSRQRERQREREKKIFAPKVFPAKIYFYGADSIKFTCKKRKIYK